MIKTKEELKKIVDPLCMEVKNELIVGATIKEIFEEVDEDSKELEITKIILKNKGVIFEMFIPYAIIKRKQY